MKGVTLVLVFAALFFASAAPAETEAGKITDSKAVGMGFMAAAVVVGLGTLAAGIAVGLTGSAAIGALAEKPELMGKLLIIIGLAEGIAIYGLIVGLMILGKF
ncbi:MAG: ATP synthase subunit C [Candidatus Wallbacteria bacterium]|nr:ATP synthase subunit C [Candidatus Wallbacteria bacterium]